MSIQTLQRALSRSDYSIGDAAARYHNHKMFKDWSSDEIFKAIMNIFVSNGFLGLLYLGEELYYQAQSGKQQEKRIAVTDLVAAAANYQPGSAGITFAFEDARYLAMPNGRGGLLCSNINSTFEFTIDDVSLRALHDRAVIGVQRHANAVANRAEVEFNATPVYQAINQVSLFLDEDAKGYFAQLLAIPSAENNADASLREPVILDGISGSLARIVLAAMQAGRVELNDIGIHLLAELVNSEAEVINRYKTNAPDFGDVVVEFKRNQEIQQKQEELLAHIQYGHSTTPLVIVDAGLKAVFCCNQDASKVVLRNLKFYGAQILSGVSKKDAGEPKSSVDIDQSHAEDFQRTVISSIYKDSEYGVITNRGSVLWDNNQTDGGMLPKMIRQKKLLIPANKPASDPAALNAIELIAPQLPPVPSSTDDFDVSTLPAKPHVWDNTDDDDGYIGEINMDDDSNEEVFPAANSNSNSPRPDYSSD